MDNVAGARHDAALALPPDEKHALPPSAHAVMPAHTVGGRGVTAGGQGIRVKGNYLDADEDGHIGQEGDEWPSEEDLTSLRKVPDRISLAAYTVAIVELCERFSYYGTSVICEFFPPSMPNTRMAALMMSSQSRTSSRGHFLPVLPPAPVLPMANLAPSEWGSAQEPG